MFNGHFGERKYLHVPFNGVNAPRDETCSPVCQTHVRRGERRAEIADGLGHNVTSGGRRRRREVVG